jgi:hypothetical protein
MITSAVYTLSDTTAAQVASPSNMPQEVHLHNMSKSSNQYVFIGNSDVSTTNAIHLDPGESKVLQLKPLHELWAVSDPTGLVLGVLQIRQD